MTSSTTPLTVINASISINSSSAVFLSYVVAGVQEEEEGLPWEVVAPCAESAPDHALPGIIAASVGAWLVW